MSATTSEWARFLMQRAMAHGARLTSRQGPDLCAVRAGSAFMRDLASAFARAFGKSPHGAGVQLSPLAAYHAVRSAISSSLSFLAAACMRWARAVSGTGPSRYIFSQL